MSSEEKVKRPSFSLPIEDISDEIPPIAFWRMAEPEDVPEILKLIKVPYTKEMFGDVNIGYLVELAYLPISVLNTNGNVVAFMALCDYPNIPAVPPDEWLDSIKIHYRLEQLTVRNTLFIHMLLWSNYYAHTSLVLLLESLFLNFTYLQHIIMVAPPGATASDIFDEHFTRIYPDYEATDFSKIQSIYICLRQRHVKQLKIRLAMEEDNDDLMEIFSNTDTLRKKYGDYFFAELCLYGGDSRRIIVAEEKDEAIGVMCLNSDVKLQLLNENFNLPPFHGLCKPCNLDHLLKTDRLKSDSKLILHAKDIDCGELPQFKQSKSRPLHTVPEEEDDCKGGLCCCDSSSTSSSSQSLEQVLPPPSLIDLADPPPLFAAASQENLHQACSNLLYSLEEQTQKMFEEQLDWMTSKAFGREFNEKNRYEQKIPEFFTEKNAFAIEIFGMKEEYDERMAYDFLTSAFECFPDLDYCIITVPPNIPVFPLLLHFVRAVPRPERAFQHELYVAHRNSVLSLPVVREALIDDYQAVELLVKRVEGADSIIADFLVATKGEDTRFYAYVFTSEETVVGVAIIRHLQAIRDLQARYDLEELCDVPLHGDNHALLRHLVLCPIFMNHTNFFFKELHRLSQFTSFHYILKQQRGCSIPSVLNEMVAVRPRRRIQYYNPALGCNFPPPSQTRNESPVPLMSINQRICSTQRVDVNHRIVVVGTSTTAFAFLEKLVMGRLGERMTNVTLVSTHGICSAEATSLPRATPVTSRYTRDYLRRIALHVWINIVYGVMTDINRKKKYIVVNGESVVYYDYLYLFCGTQFMYPDVHDRINWIYDRNICHSTIDCKESPRGPAEYPQNIFVVNCQLDASTALSALRRMIFKMTTYNVVVYGHNVSAFCFLALLLDYGIPGSNITFVEPFPDYKGTKTCTVFNNEEVDDAVMRSLKTAGVKVYSGYFLHCWELSPTEPKIVTAVFTKKTRAVSIECTALFYFGKKGIIKPTYEAIKRACLLFDGKLIIDFHFRTNDPCIFAAGKLTKYSDRFFADSHRHFDPVEIGEQVAMELLSKLPCNLESGNDMFSSEEEALLSWRWERPVMMYARLPGGAHYLHVRCPEKEEPREIDVASVNYGTDLVTGSCSDTEKGYFKLHLGEYKFVKTITCYSKKEIDTDNLLCLYGKHERLLNNLVYRFEHKRIDNLFEYFRQPWCYGIYHDHFDDIHEHNITDISSIQGFSGKAVIEEIGRFLKNTGWKAMPHEKKKEIQEWYSRSHLRQVVETRVLTFLRRRENSLPMYAVRKVLRHIAYTAATSPLLNKHIYHCE